MIGGSDKGTRPVVEQSKPPIQWVTEAPSSAVKGQGLRLTSQTEVKNRPG
jgi:hypothetical protein